MPGTQGALPIIPYTEKHSALGIIVASARDHE
jgi:hypothetical protein